MPTELSLEASDTGSAVSVGQRSHIGVVLSNRLMTQRQIVAADRTVGHAVSTAEPDRARPIRTWLRPARFAEYSAVSAISSSPARSARPP